MRLNTVVAVLSLFKSILMEVRKMKIVSWNLNGLIASMKNSALDPVLEMLPDIICLQEIRTQEEPKILNGYHHYCAYTALQNQLDRRN